LAKGVLSATALAGERAQAVANLEQINARVIQDLPYGVLVVDGDGAVLQSNSRAQMLLACARPPHARLAVCAPALHALWMDWRQQRVTPLPTLRLESPPQRLRIRLIELDPARQQWAVIVIEDMTELEEEAQRLKMAALGRLTANLAHEIRNPLSAINHAAQLLGEDAADPATTRLTRIIEDNAGRLNWLVEDVLALSRRNRLDQESLGAPAFLADFVNQFQLGEQLADGILIVKNGADAPPVEVCFDRLHLHQILWNICRNARRCASQNPGSIELRLHRHADVVEIEIYNDGPAIPAEEMQRLFEPFYTTDNRGTGLGLYIARELAEANHGHLRIVAQEQGALFRLTCPRAPC